MRTKRHLQKKTVTKKYKKINLTKQIKKQKLKKTRINKLVGGGDNIVKSKIMICTRNEYTYLMPVLDFLERKYNFMASHIDIIYANNTLQPILAFPATLYSTTLKKYVVKPKAILIEAIAMGTHPFIIYIDDENEIISNIYGKTFFDTNIKTEFYFELYSYSYNETESYKKIEMSSISSDMKKNPNKLSLLEEIINTIPANSGLCLCIQLPHEITSICHDIFFEKIQNILSFINKKFNNNLLTVFDFDNTLTNLHLYKSIRPGMDKYTKKNETEFSNAFLTQLFSDELKEAQIVKYFGAGNIEKIKSLFQIVKSIEKPENSKKPLPPPLLPPENSKKPLPPPAAAEESAAASVLTIPKEVSVKDLNSSLTFTLTRKPSDIGQSFTITNRPNRPNRPNIPNRPKNTKSLIPLTKESLELKSDTYVIEELALGKRFKLAITNKKNSKLLNSPYPIYINKIAESKIKEYEDMVKTKSGIFKKTNKTAGKRQTLLQDIIKYGFSRQDIEKLIRLQYHMPTILKTLIDGEKIEGMFRLSGSIETKNSFYTDSNFSLTKEVLADTHILCSLVKEYIKFLSIVKGSYFEEEIKTNNYFTNSKGEPPMTIIQINELCIKLYTNYLAYYTPVDQELLYKIFVLFSLIMNDTITTLMTPQNITIIFITNVEPRVTDFPSPDRQSMYTIFLDYIKYNITKHNPYIIV